MGGGELGTTCIDGNPALYRCARAMLGKRLLWQASVMRGGLLVTRDASRLMKPCGRSRRTDVTVASSGDRRSAVDVARNASVSRPSLLWRPLQSAARTISPADVP